MSEGGANLKRANLSTAQYDQQLIAIQTQMKEKKRQLNEDYKRLQRDVKSNSYLQLALTEYKNYFTKEKTEVKKEIQALTELIKYIEKNGDPKDIIELKREIKYIKEKKV